jgi:glycine cleavage system H lipoate-binding protein
MPPEVTDYELNQSGTVYYNSIKLSTELEGKESITIEDLKKNYNLDELPTSLVYYYILNNSRTIYYNLAKLNENDLQEAGDELKADLAKMLEESKMITDFVCIKNGEVIEVDTSIEVTLSRINRKFEQEIKQNIQNKADEFYKLYNWDFEQDLRESDLIRTLSAVKEVQGYDINFTTNDQENSGNLVVAKYYQIIRSAEINISFMYV